MSTFTRDRYYNHAGPGYYDEQDEIPEEDLHPHVRRQAERIVQRHRMSRLRQWWISFVGGMAAVATAGGMVLAGMNFILGAMVVTSLAILACLYLTSLSLRTVPNT